MRDIGNFSGGIRDEIVLAGPGFVPIRRRDVGYFGFDGGMRDDIVQNATWIDIQSRSSKTLYPYYEATGSSFTQPVVQLKPT